jgi:hypothetical protein
MTLELSADSINIQVTYGWPLNLGADEAEFAGSQGVPVFNPHFQSRTQLLASLQILL